MDQPAPRKPKHHFDVVANPSHVTFDDGKERRRNFPWSLYAEALWDFREEPDVVKIEIGDWLVVVSGHNLAALFLAIEEHTLVRLRAQPALAQRPECEFDTYAIEICFLKPPTGNGGQKRRGQSELELGS